jgi:hypothetical protein
MYGKKSAIVAPVKNTTFSFKNAVFSMFLLYGDLKQGVA